MIISIIYDNIWNAKIRPFVNERGIYSEISYKKFKEKF